MLLSRKHLAKIKKAPRLYIPGEDTFQLPEKVLQFGTGVLLRGLPDLIINNANNTGAFNGRIVMVKSTSNGNSDAFDQQDSLYTVCVRGIQDGEKVDEKYIVGSVSRVLSASNEWDVILECASNPDMQVIISNTTEVGISLVKDNIHADPPQSFPGKLLSFLYHRFKYFKGDPEKGMVVIPTELIPSNADKLLSIVLELAHINNLESSFLDWLENANHFCNSLVDRIVPGAFNKAEHEAMENELGYKDGLMIMSEVYCLWAIQATSEKIKKILSFATPQSGVVIAPDIDKFRELKLRLLNGSHTFSCGLAHLAGFVSVKNAMDDHAFTSYLHHLMYEEIIPSIANDAIAVTDARDFASQVLDRYSNSYIDHHWLSITMQYSTKMYQRNVVVIENYHRNYTSTANYMALGMAGHILFMQSTIAGDGKYYGNANGVSYLINDDNASFFSEAWKESDTQVVVYKILSSHELWGVDLTALHGFEHAVRYWVQMILDKGAYAALKEITTENTVRVNEK